MLPRIGANHRKLLMQTRGRHHINHINIRIIRDGVHVLVVVHIGVLDTVFFLPYRNLLRATGDNPAQLTVLGQLQCRRELVGAVATETDQGDAQFSRGAPQQVGGPAGREQGG